MNRNARRKLAASLRQGGAEDASATPWGRDDRRWFSAHPRRSHRVRSAFPGEYRTEPDFTIIRQIRPGLRHRRAFTLLECTRDLVGTMTNLALRATLDDSEGESAAHALFELPKGRIVSTAEILTIITACESAPGGDATN
jgi:hypothetical protein